MNLSKKTRFCYLAVKFRPEDNSMAFTAAFSVERLYLPSVILSVYHSDLSLDLSPID